jgi:hypothetical protein
MRLLKSVPASLRGSGYHIKDGQGEGRKMRTAAAIRSFVFSLVLLSYSYGAFAQVSIGISVGFGPPAIPVYEQPICPADGLLWTPGYWAYDAGGGYYWVPGTWVEAPQVGFLWTPGYWGWGGAAFFFHEGYWGPQVGFYGGINYGFGYGGVGFEGGRWDGGRFSYNTWMITYIIHQMHFALGYLPFPANLCWLKHRKRDSVRPAGRTSIQIPECCQSRCRISSTTTRENWLKDGRMFKQKTWQETIQRHYQSFGAAAVRGWRDIWLYCSSMISEGAFAVLLKVKNRVGEMM